MSGAVLWDVEYAHSPELKARGREGELRSEQSVERVSLLSQSEMLSGDQGILTILQGSWAFWQT